MAILEKEMFEPEFLNLLSYISINLAHHLLLLYITLVAISKKLSEV